MTGVLGFLYHVPVACKRWRHTRVQKEASEIYKRYGNNILDASGTLKVSLARCLTAKAIFALDNRVMIKLRRAPLTIAMCLLRGKIVQLARKTATFSRVICSTLLCGSLLQASVLPRNKRFAEEYKYRLVELFRPL